MSIISNKIMQLLIKKYLPKLLHTQLSSYFLAFCNDASICCVPKQKFSSFHFTCSYNKVIPDDDEYGNLQKKGHQFTAPIYLQTVTVTKIYANKQKQVTKLQNHVLVWNVTDWNALLSLDIITTGSYMETIPYLVSLLLGLRDR